MPSEESGTRARRTPEWECEGGEGLPPSPHADKMDDHEDVWLFTCTSCGKRLADPPGPPSMDCSCGGEWVCHRIPLKQYQNIRWFNDPRGEGDA